LNRFGIAAGLYPIKAVKGIRAIEWFRTAGEADRVHI
jgi:hypothetical protein